MKTPVHLWIVGVVMLLWNALGAANYLMTQRADDARQAALTPEQWALVEGLPLWVIAAWALAGLGLGGGIAAAAGAPQGCGGCLWPRLRGTGGDAGL